MQELLKTFPVIIETPIAWGEMDSLQHVNNIIYFRYFESARMAYFNKLNLWDYLKATGIGPILASTQCKFRIPLTYPDTVFVGARVMKMEEDRYLMEYSVASQQHGKIAAEGEGLIVSYNYRELKKVALPDEIKARIQRLESSVPGSRAA